MIYVFANKSFFNLLSFSVLGSRSLCWLSPPGNRVMFRTGADARVRP